MYPTLANALDAQLVAAEAQQAEGLFPVRLPCISRAGLLVLNELTPEYMSQARGYFERALTLDPANIEALVGAAQVDSALGANFFTNDRIARLAEAETASIKALSVAPNHAPVAHLVLAVIQMYRTARPKASPGIRAGFGVPGSAQSAHAFIGLAKYALGRAEETETHILDAGSSSSRYLRLLVDGVRRRHREVAAQFERRSVAGTEGPSKPTTTAAHFLLAATWRCSASPIRRGFHSNTKHSMPSFFCFHY